MVATEPFVGAELIRIALDPYQVILDFGELSIAIGAEFLLKSGPEKVRFDPSKREGDATLLWSLIEQRVTEVVWEDTIVFTFSSGSQVEIAPGWPRGTIYGKHTKDRLLIEDF
jgi:hypothetical protein